MSRGKPLVLITGAGGNLGTAIAAALSADFLVVGLEREATAADFEILEGDLTSDESLRKALGAIRDRYGSRIASVIHLAAFFDFSGEDKPAYRAVNVEGTARLLRALQDFEVEQFVYSGTMLVHEPTQPGERITEDTPIAPKWPYPQSKTAAEEIIRTQHGRVPYVLLHLAGVYDEESAVPTLAHQIARIYERDLQAHLYAGNLEAGQSMLHREDMVEAIRRTVERRAQLPRELTLLVGEPEAVSYRELQETIGRLIHGDAAWPTLALPQPLAKAGAWLQVKAEPVIPDSIDHGEPPFIRPFMIDMASDHYALDISRARELLDWEPRHRIREVLPKLIASLKRDPVAWYRRNKVPPPDWLESAARETDAPEALRLEAEQHYRAEHARNLWAPFVTAGLGTWLITSPATMGYTGTPLALSDVLSGLLVILLGLASLSWRLGLVRWVTALVGLWIVFAPLVFHTQSAAAYASDTLVGSLIIGFAVLTRPVPGVARVARLHGPTVPPGWDYSPSAWTQRVFIIVLAVVGFLFSRYLAAYQLGHIDGVWEPFFAGPADPAKNGTEEIITSWVSEAWPVPDAGLGALTYIVEILVGMIGSARRWRTMPWLVILFGIMIVPLGVVSITFIIIQPILLGTWCTLCLVGAVAMLIQIPYSLDELLATGQFLLRRKRAGRSLLRVFLAGDTDEGETGPEPPGFDRAPGEVLRDILGGGVGLPWNLLLSTLIGLWLMLTRLTLGAEGAMADADHLIGALVITISVSALAEVGRSLRFLNGLLGLALLVTPFAFEVSGAQLAAGLVCGLSLIALSLPRGPIRNRYAGFEHRVR